ncbi:MAG: BadF/BadG/BcrA/BcrD ATPase family protein, partial [Candidatus Sulfotelmatobacter sp.]
MPYYLGIDGGGSKTTCAVGDATSLLATASAGPSNVVRVGEARARESLRQAVRQACGAAGIGVQQIERVCIGAAGAGRDKTASLLRKILVEILNPELAGQVLSGRIVSQPFLPSQIDLVGDTQIALKAAFGSGPGVIVIAGTGSIAYGRDQHGNIARAGGWGFAISDEGSAHWIGRAALSAVLCSMDEGADSSPPLLH